MIQAWQELLEFSETYSQGWRVQRLVMPVAVTKVCYRYYKYTILVRTSVHLVAAHIIRNSISLSRKNIFIHICILSYYG